MNRVIAAMLGVLLSLSIAACGEGLYGEDLDTMESQLVTSSGAFYYEAGNTEFARQNTVRKTILLTAGDTIEVGTDLLPGASANGTDTLLRLYFQGTEVAYNHDIDPVGGNYASYFAYTVPATRAGAYEIRAGCHSDIRCQGTVAWRVANGPPPPAPVIGGLVINEFSTRGPTGLAWDEFVELYNNSPYAIDLTGYSLCYRASASTYFTQLSADFGTTQVPKHIFPGQYFLLATSDYTGSVPADGSTNRSGLNDQGGSLWLARTGGSCATGPTDPNLVDLVGWGNAEAFNREGSAAPSPGGTTTARGIGVTRLQPGRDTNDNGRDFERRPRSPQASDLNYDLNKWRESFGADLVKLARDHLASFDYSNGRFRWAGLASIERIDARVGMPGRIGLSSGLIATFDFYYRIENADWGSTALYKGLLNGHEVYAIYQTIDGDEEWVEILKPDGALLASARVNNVFGLLMVDSFPGEGRLCTAFTSSFYGGYEMVDGCYDSVECAAAGLIAPDWQGDVTINWGTVFHQNGKFMTADLPSTLTFDQRKLALASLHVLWERTLRHRYPVLMGDPLSLGPDGQGVLRLGSFTRPDGRTYLVADWNDLDDDSFVFYFADTAFGPQLAIQQYDN